MNTQVGLLSTLDLDVHNRMVFGKKDGKLVKAQLTDGDTHISIIVSQHQQWLKDQLKSDTPVFGLIIGEPDELLSA